MAAHNAGHFTDADLRPTVFDSSGSAVFRGPCSRGQGLSEHRNGFSRLALEAQPKRTHCGPFRTQTHAQSHYFTCTLRDRQHPFSCNTSESILFSTGHCLLHPHGVSIVAAHPDASFARPLLVDPLATLRPETAAPKHLPLFIYQHPTPNPSTP